MTDLRSSELTQIILEAFLIGTSPPISRHTPLQILVGASGALHDASKQIKDQTFYLLSRIKSIGRVNRRLAIFQVPATAENGDPIFAAEKPVGTLTRVARAAPNEDTTHALGYLKKTAYESS